MNTGILLIGATGVIGCHVLDRLIADSRVTGIIAPTRRPLAPHGKLANPLVDFERLPKDAPWWCADAVICTLGTTRSAAGSADAFWRVDHDYPLEAARIARSHGARAFALTSALNADPGSRFLYSRTKGALEQDLVALDFPSLTLVRPGLIDADRADFRAGERFASVIARVLAPVLPLRLRMSRPESIADALIAGAVDATPGRHVVEAERLA